MIALEDETHDCRAVSWVESANNGTTDFPIQNLPFGVFRQRNWSRAHIGVAIGDSILDLDQCAENGLLTTISASTIEACRSACLNELMSLARCERLALRKQIFKLLRAEADISVPELLRKLLVGMSEVDLQLPTKIGDYTDFYASLFHAANVGSMLRPNDPLPPNYKWVPIGYHGRASSIVITGTPIHRPQGQSMLQGSTTPAFGPSQRLDYEVEVGAYIAEGNRLGSAVPIAEAEEKIFGLCLVNDWSARHIQSWEYQPLGPLLSKRIDNSVKHCEVTIEELITIRTSRITRPPQHPDT
jgi:fumarylacetoacetase